MKFLLHVTVLYIVLPFLMGCTARERVPLMGQGAMVGEVGDKQAILQTRLTATDRLTDGDLPGVDGWVKFSWWPENSEEDTKSSPWLISDESKDHIVKVVVDDLMPNEIYHYRVFAASDSLSLLQESLVGSFRTLPGQNIRDSLSFVVVTGMNYYFFHFGNYDQNEAYTGEDKHLGYPALQSIIELNPDYFVGTGDNVYFDHPATKIYDRAVEQGKKPLPGLFHGKEVIDELGMRRKYHVQFSQPRFVSLFAHTATYWEKDDHDYRVNDADPFIEFPISHTLGIKNFREQLPVIDPTDPDGVTYRTHRVSADCQIWFLEGRDYRSPNAMVDGPQKTLWGETQRLWLQETLLSSNASYKIIISPTPLVGPDDAYKKDNHVNPLGFRTEGTAFFEWLKDHSFSPDSLFIICGDRHWQYHATHPSGFHEFSCGAIVDANARAGRLAGDPKSTDPEAKVTQHYVQGTKEKISGGFLRVWIGVLENRSYLQFHFMDELGQLLYQYDTRQRPPG